MNFKFHGDALGTTSNISQWLIRGKSQYNHIKSALLFIVCYIGNDILSVPLGSYLISKIITYETQ